MEHQNTRDEQRAIIRQRIQNSNTEDRQLIVIPADETNVLNDESREKRVCAYCRVSTDDPAQTTSYELQKKHYEEQINQTQGWTFAGIYADEGISATSLKNRDEFNRMIADCYNGKIDVIITKNVSRFARNVVDCLSIVRKLAQLNPPVGVKFETEGFFSLDNTSEMILTVLAAAAQEESKTKSMSMNWSLEKRFDNGNFLTPVLMGYDHDADGNLVVNPDEATIVRMIYYLFLAGFTLTELADLLTEMEVQTKRGNTSWSTSSIRGILENERYCGNVLSWKTYTYDFWEHRKRKNNKNRKQVLEIDHHEAIVSHEIYETAQAKLQMQKHMKSGSSIPTIDVVDGGALKGFVPVNRSWRGFTGNDYKEASDSVYNSEPVQQQDAHIQRSHFKLDGFEIARAQFFNMKEKPVMTIANNKITFNTKCMQKFQNVQYVELLINAVEQCVAIRPCSPDSPNAICWGRKKDNKWIPSAKSITGFASALFDIAGWNPQDKYRLCGQYLCDGDEQMLLFDLSEPEIIRMVQRGVTHFEDETNTDVSDLNCTDGKHQTMGKSKESDQADLHDSEKDVIVYGIETTYPPEWEGSFGVQVNDESVCFYERVRYQGDWEILRPAKFYATAGNISKHVIAEIQTETRKILERLGRVG